MAEAAVFGALFLFSVVAPAYVGEPGIFVAGSDTSWFVVLGIGGAAGVGALLTQTGSAIWEFFYPYAPGSGIDRFLRGRPRFRSQVGPTLGAYWDQTELPGWTIGERALISTEYLLYEQAPAEVRAWVSRRNERYVDGLTTAAAIALGLALGHLAFPRIVGWRVVVDVAFIVIAVASALVGHQAHRYAEQMERFWFAIRSAGIESKPPVT